MSEKIEGISLRKKVKRLIPVAAVALASLTEPAQPGYAQSPDNPPPPTSSIGEIIIPQNELQEIQQEIENANGQIGDLSQNLDSEGVIEELVEISQSRADQLRRLMIYRPEVIRDLFLDPEIMEKVLDLPGVIVERPTSEPIVGRIGWGYAELDNGQEMTLYHLRPEDVTKEVYDIRFNPQEINLTRLRLGDRVAVRGLVLEGIVSGTPVGTIFVEEVQRLSNLT